jgi:hypothetical protein
MIAAVTLPSAVACFFQAARLRLQRAIRAVADDLGLDPDTPCRW